jgi:hypothetical protein
MFMKLKSAFSPNAPQSAVRKHTEAHAPPPGFSNPRALESRYPLAVMTLVVRGILVISTPQSWCREFVVSQARIVPGELCFEHW